MAKRLPEKENKMAFGFFKKAEKADKIYKNGKFYTQDESYPWCEAVACRGGKILACGDSESIMDWAEDDAEVVDLQGNYVLPGFIDINGHPGYEAVKDSINIIEDAGDLDEILGIVANKCDGMTPFSMEGGIAGIFGGGGLAEAEADLAEETGIDGEGGLAIEAGLDENGDLIAEESLPELQGVLFIISGTNLPEDMTGEDLREKLDERTGETPVVLLFRDKNLIVPNTAAAETVKAFAEATGARVVNMVMMAEALNLLDFDEVEQQAVNLAEDYCEKGYTSVVNNGYIEYFDSVYSDIQVEMMGSGILKQRLFDRVGLSGPYPEQAVQALLQRKKVKYQEMEGKIREAGLLVNTSPRFEDLSEELGGMCRIAAESGFNVKVNADSNEDAREALEVLVNLAGKGYRKVHFTLAHHTNFEEEERLDAGLGTEIAEAVPVGMDYLAGKEPGSVAEAVEMLTLGAAAELGVADELGSIEVGKQADFAVFEENPLDAAGIKLFRKCRARMTVVGGEIVYDEEEDVANEWYEILVKQQY